MYIIFAKNFKVLYILAFFGSLAVNFYELPKTGKKSCPLKSLSGHGQKWGCPPPPETFTEIERLLCKSIKICD